MSKRTKHENTRNPPFSYNTKMALLGTQYIDTEGASLKLVQLTANLKFEESGWDTISILIKIHIS